MKPAEYLLLKVETGRRSANYVELAVMLSVAPDPPNFWVTDGAFYMSFKFRCLEEAESVVYFAFTYPYTYKELQQCLGRLERRHANGSNSFVALQQLPDSTIYFHRWDIEF